MNWQPIETAPKDGTLILVYYLGWDEDAIMTYDLAHYDNEWVDRNDDPLPDKPSYWMPLPPLKSPDSITIEPAAPPMSKESTSDLSFLD